MFPIYQSMYQGGKHFPHSTLFLPPPIGHLAGIPGAPPAPAPAPPPLPPPPVGSTPKDQIKTEQKTANEPDMKSEAKVISTDDDGSVISGSGPIKTELRPHSPVLRDRISGGGCKEMAPILKFSVNAILSSKAGEVTEEEASSEIDEKDKVFASSPLIPNGRSFYKRKMFNTCSTANVKILQIAKRNLHWNFKVI